MNTVGGSRTGAGTDLGCQRALAGQRSAGHRLAAGELGAASDPSIGVSGIHFRIRDVAAMNIHILEKHVVSRSLFCKGNELPIFTSTWDESDSFRAC